jgi:hypothetical protein
MENLSTKLIFTIWLTVVALISVESATLTMNVREFKAKGWNNIYCLPQCQIACVLICNKETVDSWFECWFARPTPNFFPSCGGMKKKHSQFSLNKITWYFNG